jgi:tRNA(Ile)-lysidine synthase
LPQLAALGLDPRRLGKFAERMRDAESALISMSAEAMSHVEFDAGRQQAAFSRDLLMHLPRAIAVRLVGQVLQVVGGGQKPHALAAVEALTDRLVREPVRTTLHGCLVRSGKAGIRVLRETGRASGKARRQAATPS